MKPRGWRYRSVLLWADDVKQRMCRDVVGSSGGHGDALELGHEIRLAHSVMAGQRMQNSGHGRDGGELLAAWGADSVIGGPLVRGNRDEDFSLGFGVGKGT